MRSSILLKPVITEKALSKTEKGFYSFFVHPKANKYEVKQAVAHVYKVKVESVSIINVRPKAKKVGRYKGTTSRRKKAIVKLMPDQKIEFFDKI